MKRTLMTMDKGSRDNIVQMHKIPFERKIYVEKYSNIIHVFDENTGVETCVFRTQLCIYRMHIVK